METKLLHIFQNTPSGRESLLQSIYFCGKTGAVLTVYIPRHGKFLMYFENDVIQVDLDKSYLTDPLTAHDHAMSLITEAGIMSTLLKPKHFTAPELPDIPVGFHFMSCPRRIGDLSAKISLGYIGPRVKRILKSARFPLLIDPPVFKPWNRICVFFDGSKNAQVALALGRHLKRLTAMPLILFTQAEKNRNQDAYRRLLGSDKGIDSWLFFTAGRPEDNWYAIPHDALIILGVYGHGLIKELLCGSMPAKVQSIMTNPLMIAGPNCSAV